MDALQSFLSFLVAPVVPMPSAPSLLLAALGLALLLGIAWPRHALSRRARGFMVAGVAVAGCGLLGAAAAAPLWTGPTSGGALDWAQLMPAAGVWGLLCVGAGAERLAAAPFHHRRTERTLEAGALVLVALGASASVLAASGGVGSVWTSATQLPAGPLVPIGWCIALTGAAAVVAANASGRDSALASRTRRGALAWGAFIFAAVLAAGTLARATPLDGWPAAPYVLPALTLTAYAALAALAWTVRRVLTRPSVAADGRATHARSRPPQAARLAPTIPLATAPVAADIAPIAALGHALTTAGRPFAPPALRRSLIATTAARPTEVTASPALPPAANGPADPHAQFGLLAASNVPANPWAASELALADQHDAAVSANLAARPALSPQFVTAVLELQTELLRAGREYSFEDLVNVFTSIGPRGAAARPLWTNVAARRHAPEPPLLTPPPALATRDDRWPEQPPANMPRIRPTIVP